MSSVPSGHAGASRLLFPALRLVRGRATTLEHVVSDHPDLDVGGFIVFGGDAPAVRDLVAALQGRAGGRLLVAADLERGAGQQFTGCTALPPFAALASLGDEEILWRAGALTAREALALGVGWVLAPVADLDIEPRNPIVGTRSAGGDPDAVARAVAAWCLGCASAGALACAKHFPGHGRTTADSHTELPVVGAAESELAADLTPFAAAVEADVPSVMTAHVAYPALDASGRPATRSRSIVEDVLRRRLRFRGVVVSDALNMAAVADGTTAEQAAAEAVGAGVDALLYPADAAATAGAIEGADGPGHARVREALGRLRRLRGRLERAATERGEVVGPVGAPVTTGAEIDAPDGAGAAWGRREDLAWARDVALRSVRDVVPASGVYPAPRVLVTIDDDEGGRFATPPRDRFASALGELGVAFKEDEPARDLVGVTALVAVYADVRGWKGRAGLSWEARDRVAEVAASAARTWVILFGHPRLAGQLPSDAAVLCAWGGEPLMQEAAARALARRLAVS